MLSHLKRGRMNAPSLFLVYAQTVDLQSIFEGTSFCSQQCLCFYTKHDIFHPRQLSLNTLPKSFIPFQSIVSSCYFRNSVRLDIRNVLNY